MSIDPMEEMVRVALSRAQIIFEQNPANGLDFKIHTKEPIYIEVKQFHSNRIAEQMSRADDVIVLQGRLAVQYFCMLMELVKRFDDLREDLHVIST